jgi:hypothetical protein
MIVEGFMGTPAKPMMAAVMMSGIMFGSMETAIILMLENIKAMSNEIKTMAIRTLWNR